MPSNSNTPEPNTKELKPAEAAAAAAEKKENSTGTEETTTPAPSYYESFKTGMADYAATQKISDDFTKSLESFQDFMKSLVKPLRELFNHGIQAAIATIEAIQSLGNALLDVFSTNLDDAKADSGKAYDAVAKAFSELFSTVVNTVWEGAAFTTRATVTPFKFFASFIPEAKKADADAENNQQQDAGSRTVSPTGSQA